jgi:hypothetical protein
VKKLLSCFSQTETANDPTQADRLAARLRDRLVEIHAKLSTTVVLPHIIFTDRPQSIFTDRTKRNLVFERSMFCLLDRDV